jgi:hypothetical protein
MLDNWCDGILSKGNKEIVNGFPIYVPFNSVCYVMGGIL